jgi:colanic acid/amylovoran biosynthesis glycosyltransferase
MRVLHTLDYFVSVTENWVYPQVTQVPGVESRVVCSVAENLEAFPIDKRNLTVHPPPWNFAFGVPRLFSAVARRVSGEDVALALKVRMWRPLVLHAHFGMRGWGSLALKKRLGIPLVTSFYGWDAWLLPQEEPVWRQRYKELFTIGDLFLVEGPAMRERLAQLGCPADKVHVHRIGVDLSRLPFEAKEFSGDLKIVMVGRFTEKKGLLDGLQACARASSLGVKLSVTIIGDPLSNDDAGERIKEELHALAERPELAGRVRLTGFLPLGQTRALVAAHDVLLCPSKQAANGDAEGGSPVVLTEAMALGLLCIGARHCDIPEVIIDEKTGYLCNEGDVAAMADVLCSLGRDPGKLRRLTAAGRKRVEENFSLPTQLQRVRSIYSSLLNGTNGYHKGQV